eukprot:GFUD01010262.1.p1 GENE.GFUD01010262.1~~GFUD01010262.1.p1  ORF type:complete len:499 (-),score=133.69 GFUD01010262.1:90-1586(-)
MSAELSQDDLDYIDSMFDSIDINQDGSISLRELTKSMKDKGNSPRNQEIQKMFEEADMDGDGEIDWSEFLDMTKRRMKSANAPEPTNQPETMKRVEPKGFKPQKTPKVTVDQPKNVLDTKKKTEILKMFNRMDPNGNGFVEKKEFEEYLDTQGTHLSKERMAQLYKSISESTTLDSVMEESGITFQDMIKYFENEDILEDNVEINIGQDKLESIDDIAEYFAMANLTGTQLDSSSHLTLANGISRKDTVKETMKDLVSRKTIMKANLGDQSKKRWQPFASFKRRVDRKTVMSSPSGIIRDYLPGNYSMADIAKFDDLPPIKPVRTIVQCQWVQGEAGKPSKLIFPDNFSGELETDIATSETLAYYGAYLAESTNENFALDSRHVLQDFTYGNDYFETWVLGGGGGAALETHNFSHLDCPLTPMKKSGYFVMAKFVDDARTSIEITAFQVPTRHTIYTPGGVVHSNNYLKGTWRTMLADGPIDEGKIEKNGQPLRFTFK